MSELAEALAELLAGGTLDQYRRRRGLMPAVGDEELFRSCASGAPATFGQRWHDGNPRRPWHADPPLTDEQREAAIVASCASGAPAELPARPVVELGGREVPVPLGFKPRPPLIARPRSSRRAALGAELAASVPNRRDGQR